MKKEQVANEVQREMHQRIQKRASEMFSAMNGDVARGELGGMTKTQVQMKFLTWQMARLDVMCEGLLDDTK